MDENIRKLYSLPSYTEEDISFSINEIAKHKQINAANNNKVFDKAIGAIYTGNFARKSLKRSVLSNCQFHDVDFTRVAATGSKFTESIFTNCNFWGSNFQYCDFSNSIFSSSDTINLIEGGNFGESNFSNTKFLNSSIISCSFSSVLFDKIEIENSKIRSTTFENGIFKNSSFINVEMRNLNIDFADFENVQMKNVVLPFSQIPYTFGLLPYLYDTSDEVWISSKINLDKKISVSEYKIALNHLEKYYLSIDEFFPLANIYLAQKSYESAYLAIINGLLSSINLRDFRLLKFFCKLAVKSKGFSSDQLKELYNRIHMNISYHKLSLSETHNYQIHSGEIRSLLLNNNLGKLSVKFYLKTTIDNGEEDKLGLLIRTLNQTINNEDNSLKWDYYELRHRSPYEVLLQISQTDIARLVTIIISVYTVLMRANKLYQSFCESIIKTQLIRRNEIDINQLKEKEKILKENKINVYEVEHNLINTTNESLNNDLYHYHFKNED